MGIAVIFGGTGFIGSFFRRHLIEEQGFKKVYLYDQESIRSKGFKSREKMLEAYHQIMIISGNVRKKIDWFPSESVDLVANFAAVHREPGH